MLLSLLISLLSVADVRAMADAGTPVVQEDLVLEARVISEPANPNLDMGTQRDYRTCSMTQNNRTAYVQDAEGRLGLRLVFQHLDPEARKLTRYSLVRISLKGASLLVDGPCYSVTELPNGSVLEVSPGTREDIPLKVRKVREIQPEDVYTLVSVPDCEFVFKDGAYLNIREDYAVKSPDNPELGGNGYMGTWQSLLCDSDASALYAVLNTRVPWRRSGNGVPKGKGSIEGIVVRSDIARYGKTWEPQIRPLHEEDFRFEREGPSAFSTICEWNWGDNSPLLRTSSGPAEKITAGKILPDEGTGELYLDFPAEVRRGRDCNNPVREKGKNPVRGLNGQELYGSMQILAPAAAWWNWGDDCGNSVVVKFSTEGLSGDRLFLAFSFAAGDNAAVNARMCPAFWGVEVSTDDVNIARVDYPDICLRAYPWWVKTLDGVTYYTSMECGMGLTEHLVPLPSSLFGQKEVYVRITPVRRNVLTLAEQGGSNACLRPNCDSQTAIEFGAIAIRYR